MNDGSLQRLAEDVLIRAHRAAHELVQSYVSQVFRVRHHRQPRLDTLFGCRLQTVPPNDPTLFIATATPGCNAMHRSYGPEMCIPPGRH